MPAVRCLHPGRLAPCSRLRSCALDGSAPAAPPAQHCEGQMVPAPRTPLQTPSVPAETEIPE